MVTISSHAGVSGCVCNSREKRTVSGKEIQDPHPPPHCILIFFPPCAMTVHMYVKAFHSHSYLEHYILLHMVGLIY